MALIKIGIVFLVILLLLYRKVKLWISLLGATMILGLLFHLSFAEIGINLLMATVDSKTVLLISALLAILFFSHLLKETGRMREILEGLAHLFKDIRLVIAILPAIIGLMPILGGALVSAPMVVEGSDKLKLSPERRTFINYWFRHVWEFTLPTFPGLILFASLVGVPVRRFGWLHLPFTLTAILSGFLIGFQGVRKLMTNSGSVAEVSSLWRLAENLFPFFLAIFLVIFFKIELVIALSLSILVMIGLFRIEGRVLKSEFIKSLDLELFLTISVIMGFKKVLECSHAIEGISETLASSSVPPLLMVTVIPLLVGLMAGAPIAIVGISFPILIPLFREDPKFLNYMSLAFISGLSGHLLSPFHLCLILTKEYFKADWKGIYRLTWIPATSLLLIGLFKAVLF
jgi:integral membrane protein (TIGR00529 family)